MRVVAAYLLAQLGGNATPSAADVKSILSSVGIEADDERINAFMSQVEGKNVDELIASGKGKLASVSVAVAGSAAPAAAGGAAAAPAAAAKEEKKEEEEETTFSGGGLFGGGDDEEW